MRMRTEVTISKGEIERAVFEMLREKHGLQATGDAVRWKIMTDAEDYFHHVESITVTVMNLKELPEDE